MGCIKLYNYTWPVKIYILAHESNARQSDDNMESICSLDDDKNWASILLMVCGRIKALIMSSITTFFFFSHKTKFFVLTTVKHRGNVESDNFQNFQRNATQFSGRDV